MLSYMKLLFSDENPNRLGREGSVSYYTYKYSMVILTIIVLLPIWYFLTIGLGLGVSMVFNLTSCKYDNQNLKSFYIDCPLPGFMIESVIALLVIIGLLFYMCMIQLRTEIKEASYIADKLQQNYGTITDDSIIEINH